MSITTGIYVMCAVAIISTGAFSGFVAWLSHNAKGKRRHG